jgi:hypothetical protein
MLTIFWLLRWIHLIDALLRGGWCNSSCFGRNIRDWSHANLLFTWTVRLIMMHMDIASLHGSKERLTYMKEFVFRPVSHPPFSPDLAPSGFYLFGTIKGRPRGRSIQDAREPAETISEVTSSIWPTELNTVFRTWEGRRRRCAELSGEYVDWDDAQVRDRFLYIRRLSPGESVSEHPRDIQAVRNVLVTIHGQASDDFVPIWHIS